MADKETITEKNQQLSQITAECSNIEENTSQYRSVQRACDNLLITMENSIMPAAKYPMKTFFEA
jgi:hypothetical protein